MTDRDSITRTRARAPGAEGDPPSRAVHRPVGGPAQYGATAPTLRCTKGDGKPSVSRCMPGAGLSLKRPGRPRLTGQPSSRTGENPPYGMSGGIEETSASFEARSAPRSYPTFREGTAPETLLVPAKDGSSEQIVDLSWA